MSATNARVRKWLPTQPVETTHAPQRFRRTLCSVGYVLVCQDQADNVDIGVLREHLSHEIGSGQNKKFGGKSSPATSASNKPTPEMITRAFTISTSMSASRAPARSFASQAIES